METVSYSFAGSGILVALFGIGTFAQVNSITSSLGHSFGLSPQVVSIILAIFVATIIFGGIHSISKVAEKSFLSWLFSIFFQVWLLFSYIISTLFPLFV